VESSLYYNTVSNSLKDILIRCMRMKEFNHFRLVGGTSLSLQLGHRMSEDIDLFSDIDYGKLDFKVITKIMQDEFKVIEFYDLMVVGNGRAYKVGDAKRKNCKSGC
jgi:hypothetical protein